MNLDDEVVKLLSDLKIVNIEILLSSATANIWAIGISKVCFRSIEKMVYHRVWCTHASETCLSPSELASVSAKSWSLLWILKSPPIGWEHFDFRDGSPCVGSSIGGIVKIKKIRLMRVPLYFWLNLVFKCLRLRRWIFYKLMPDTYHKLKGF